MPERIRRVNRCSLGEMPQLKPSNDYINQFRCESFYSRYSDGSTSSECDVQGEENEEEAFCTRIGCKFYRDGEHTSDYAFWEKLLRWLKSRQD